MPRLAILTSGGDSPGMNMAIWAATQAAWELGWTVQGIPEGFSGLLQGEWIDLKPTHALRFARLGGTFLGTAREPDFASKVPAAIRQLEQAEITHLLVLGGNGSLAGAARIAEAGYRVVGLPCTIDNDVDGSEEAIGFDSALNLGLLLADALRDTAEALPRIGALETLGGNTGFLAQAVAKASGADVALLPEFPLAWDDLERQVAASMNAQNYALLVASEGYPDLLSTLEQIEQHFGLRVRLSRIGHAQRGGRPSGHDRLLARSLAEAAVRALAQNQCGLLACKAGKPELVPLGNRAERKPLSR